MSYDITSLAGVIVTDAAVTYDLQTLFGSPALGVLWVGVTEWGVEPLVVSDFNLGGVGIESFVSPNFTCSNQKLIDELQDAIDDGKSRFQVRIHFGVVGSDGNGSWDGWSYFKSHVNLNVVYTAP